MRSIFLVLSVLSLTSLQLSVAKELEQRGFHGILTDVQAKFFLDDHNKYRKLFATGVLTGYPYATDMIKLYWNHSLAADAKTYADQCKNEYDATTTDGESISVASDAEDTLNNFNSLNALWRQFISENRDYNYATNTCDPGKTCRRFLQAMWADTRSLGCAYAECNDNGLSLGAENPYQIIWICRYSSAYESTQKPYTSTTESSQIASECPIGYAANNGLCELLPTPRPTVVSSSPPSLYPSSIPTPAPSSIPSFFPSTGPSLTSSMFPSSVPSTFSSLAPSSSPISVPSLAPSSLPISVPSNVPSQVPSLIPTFHPTSPPSQDPTYTSSPTEDQFPIPPRSKRSVRISWMIKGTSGVVSSVLFIVIVMKVIFHFRK